MNLRPSDDPEAVTRPFDEFREAGLLWLINAAVFHPRGFAIAFDFDADGDATGWQLLGDGTEPWQYATDPETLATVDAMFHKAQEFLEPRYKDAPDA